MSSARERWREKPRWVRILTYAIMGLIAAVGMGVLFGLIIMWLWNWLMPMLFHLPTINYWEGIGIFVLAKIIFGIGGGSSSDKGPREKRERKHHGNHHFHVEVNTEPDGEDYYDAWWEAVGKKSFEDYAKSKKDDDKKDETKDCAQ